MDDQLLGTIEDLAAATKTSVEDLREWQALGLLAGTEGMHPLEDLEHVRLIRYAEAHGIDAATIADAARVRGIVLGDYVEMITAGRPRVGRPLDEAAATSGLDPATLERLWAAAGLQDQDEAYPEDVEALRWLRRALDLGLPEDALAQIVRVFADCLGRVAEAEARLFHYYVHERLRAAGVAGHELTEATVQISAPLTELVEPALLYFHRKAYQRTLRDDMLLHVGQDGTPPGEVPGEIRATILFVDLSGFTTMTGAMGDAAAAQLVDRFSTLVRGAAGRCRGKVVKQIGDEFMLVFSDPAAAVSCGLDIQAATAAEPQFPALRLGAHAGTVLYREGDYIGTTVNVAARVVAEAQRHEFLVTGALLAEATSLTELEVAPAGTRRLRGISEGVELFHVRRREPRSRRAVDPVCLMELDPALAAVNLTRDGTEVHFCSDDCLARFVATPDAYAR